MGHRSNKEIPNNHFRKDWQRRVKTWFGQPGGKLRRRNRREAKAKASFPRPVAGLVRPVVHAPTARYNRKARLGRGFSLAELKEAGVSKRSALGLGISVDHRRRNKSDRSLKDNVQRLKQYKSKLVVFPRRKVSKRHPAKKTDASAEEQSKVTQLGGRVVLPVARAAVKTRHRVITDEEKKSKVSMYAWLRRARADARLVGIRKKRAEDKAKEPGAQAKADIKADRGRLTDADIERMISDAERYREEDLALARKIHLRNALEEAVYSVKSSLTERNDIAGISELDDVISWIESESEAATQEQLQRKADQLYSRFGIKVDASSRMHNM